MIPTSIGSFRTRAGHGLQVPQLPVRFRSPGSLSFAPFATLTYERSERNAKFANSQENMRILKGDFVRELAMPAAVSFAATALLLAAVPSAPPAQQLTPGFHRSPWFGEQVKEQWIEGDVRVLVNLPAEFDPTHPAHLVVYATPNGNTIEWTLGSATGPGQDWHFDIQHVAARFVDTGN